ncbi:MAG: hypothetical protein ACR65U_07500 [Methylocystis sp.]
MAVVELAIFDDPFCFVRVFLDLLADCADARSKWRDVFAPVNGFLRFRFRDGREYSVGEIVDQRNEKMARPHRRVAYFQIENGGRGIMFGKLLNARGHRLFGARQALGFPRKGV